MITLPELLEDKRYEKYFSTTPSVGASTANWRIYVQRKADGPWRRKDFQHYDDAYKRITREIDRGLHDGAIQSRGIAYAPPQRIVRVTRGGKPVMVKTPRGPEPKTAVVIWKPKLHAEDEPHMWCTYCRRPTVFRWFTSHHALRNSPVAGIHDPADRRCTICGGREDFIRAAAGQAWKPGDLPLHLRPRRKRRK